MKLIVLVILIVHTVSCKHTKRQAVQGCPIDFIRFEESCYHVFDIPHLKWWDAMSFCAMFGHGEGSLATIESAAEETFLETQLKSSSGHRGDFWLGATDMVHENNYVWIHKNEYVNEYTNWAPGQPSSGTSENCLALYKGVQFKWNDAPCNLAASFICEVPFIGTPTEVIG